MEILEKIHLTLTILKVVLALQTNLKVTYHTAL